PPPHRGVAVIEFALHLLVVAEQVHPKFCSNVSHRIIGFAGGVKTPDKTLADTQLQIVLHSSREVFQSELAINCCLRADMIDLAGHRQVNSLLIRSGRCSVLSARSWP